MENIESVEKHVSAAYDSVNLINNLLTEEKTEENSKSVEINYKHLEIMLSKDWFESSLTPEQKTEITNCINSAKAY